MTGDKEEAIFRAEAAMASALSPAVLYPADAT